MSELLPGQRDAERAREAMALSGGPDDPAHGPPKRILVAGIGNAWMKDDAFGGRVAERLEDGALPEEAAVFDFGTGGLDLAYEAMRGYDALILIDVSRQGGDPGTLYVMDAEPDDLQPIEDGEVMSPHAMDPLTVLRFVKAVGGWPGKVKIVACEPASVEEMGVGLSPEVEEAVERAVEVVKETVTELLSDAAYASLDEPGQGTQGAGIEVGAEAIEVREGRSDA